MRATVIALACIAAIPALAEDYPEPLAIGAPAPDFSLPSVDGKSYGLADFKEAKVLALVFTCNHCPTAQAYEGRLLELAHYCRDNGAVLVAINPNDPQALRLDELGYTDLGDSFDDMKIRARELGWDFPYLYDGDTQAVSRQYGPVSTPHVFVFDAERKLRYRGRIDDSEDGQHITTSDARNAIDALLQGKPVPVETTKTSGCSTKWSSKRQSVQDSLAKWAAEEVTLKTVDEAAVKELIANKRDKLRLVNVYATWCGPCVEEFPELVTMHRMYRNRDFELVTISGDKPEQEDKVLKFLQRHEASTSNYLFNGQDTYKLIEAVDKEWEGAFPYTLLIAPGGKIVYRHMGGIDPLEVRKAIVEQLGRTF